VGASSTGVNVKRTLPFVLTLSAAATIATASHAASDTDLQTQIQELRDQIAAQQKLITDQQKKLNDLERKVSDQAANQKVTAQPASKKLTDQSIGQKVQNPDAIRGTGAGPANVAQTDQPVGQPEQKERPQVSAISDVGGVLTPKGTLTVEPTLEYDNSQVNRFFFAGTEIVNAVFIGGLEAENARQNTIIAGLNGRYGITNRLEASVRVPYVYRYDRTSNGPASDTLQNSRYGNDIGDVEAGLHYQINQPTNGGAYYVANLRVKSNTGTSPFDVPFDQLGQQTRLPTGSGAWAVEPSITALYPVDPVVLYGNIGYAKSFSFDPNKNVPTLGFVSEVTPGDALRGTFGMGFALNDRISMSLGYEHDWVQPTTTTTNGVKAGSEELQIGSLNLGISYAVTPRIAINLNAAIGATRDAPDERLMLSVPINFDVFK